MSMKYMVTGDFLVVSWDFVVDFIAMDVAFAELIFRFRFRDRAIYRRSIKRRWSKTFKNCFNIVIDWESKGKKKQKLEKMKWKSRGESPSLDEEACLSTWAGWATLIILIKPKRKPILSKPYMTWQKEVFWLVWISNLMCIPSEGFISGF